MGNCLERSRRGRGGEHYAKKRAVWAEEKVVAENAEEKVDVKKAKEEEEEEETRKGEGETPAPAADHQVKIRITRKQLEELLRRVDDGKQDGGGGVPAREVISELLCETSSSNFRHRGAQGQWRPSLQSIPE